MITSTTNNKIKNINLLVKKSKERRNQNAFIAEGIRFVSETPADLLKEVYISESFSRSNEGKALADRLSGSSCFFETVSDEVFKFMSDTQTPQGVLAVVSRPKFTLEQIAGGDNPLVVVLENLQDPGNLGTILRTAEGAGVSGIIMSKNTVDIYSPKVVRSTMGSIYRVPHISVEDLPATLTELKDNYGIQLFAAHLKGSSYYSQLDFTSKCGFIIGNEGNGLTDEIANMADTYLKIPMEGNLESLNAAMACGILLYETHRQRHL